MTKRLANLFASFVATLEEIIVPATSSPAAFISVPSTGFDQTMGVVRVGMICKIFSEITGVVVEVGFCEGLELMDGAAFDFIKKYPATKSASAKIKL